jgi:DNA polymerase epsilon subunit 2
VQPEEGRYALEDLSARLPVDLSEAEQTLGLFTQNCIVVAEGELQQDGVFKVRGACVATPKNNH